LARLLRPACDRRTRVALTGLVPEHEEQCRAERDQHARGHQRC
jgi:hypothetical protein